MVFDMVISGLKTQYMENPLGLGAARPLFSYLLTADRQGSCQSACRILVSSTLEGLDRDEGDLWDSGKRQGRENFCIAYGGMQLKSRQRAYWKVKVWDEKDIESDWSSKAGWEMGLLEKEDWKGSWIGQGDGYQGDKAVAPMLVRDFSIINKGRIALARLYISGLGLFKAYINGREVADTLFAPGESDASETVYYVTYDVTEMIKEGQNTLGVILGNGQYVGFTLNPVMTDSDGKELPHHRYQKNDGRFVKPGISGDKKVIAQLEVEYENGRREIAVLTDDKWKWKESAVTFQNWYGGEDYDATREADDWNLPCGNREGWHKAVRMQPPEGVLTASEFPPIRIVEKIRPKSVSRLKSGNWLVDMGRNGAGFPELILENTDERLRGQWIRMYPAELLKENGEGVDQASCTQSWNERYHCSIVDSYRISGKGKEVWHPLFSYQGFRYVEVEGFPGELTADNLRYCIVRTDNEKNGTFHTSSELWNRINSMVERSMESNMFSVFTDCPQIEKLGWIETSWLMFRSLAGTYDISSWMRKIIHDITDSQLDERQASLEGNEEAGYVPAIVPEYQRIVGLHRDPNWGGACVYTPWEYYQYYGDCSVLHQAYPVMKKYLLYLWKHLKGGVLEDYAQMGEWGQLNEETPTVLVATCSFYRMLIIASQVADILRQEEDAKHFTHMGEKVKEAFHRHPLCYHSDTGVYGNGSQASFGCALYSGLVPEENVQAAVDHLVEAVKAKDYHLTSGEVGLKQVFIALAEHGRNDVICRMVMNETSPSYRFFAEQGFTTLPEYWNPEELWYGCARSRNHAMMGHVKEWLTYYVLGIKPVSPGFREVVIKPWIPEEIHELKGSLICPYGEIRVVYQEENGKADLRVTFPPGVSVKTQF